MKKVTVTLEMFGKTLHVLNQICCLWLCLDALSSAYSYAGESFLWLCSLLLNI